MEHISLLTQETRTLLDAMDIRSELSVTSLPDGSYDIHIESDDAPLLIGHHGSVLQSLQLMLGLILREKTGEILRLRVNVGNYREQMEERVKELVSKKAERVLSDNVKETLHPMNSYLRRIVHLHIKEQYPDIVTDSVGEEPNRRIVMMTQEIANNRESYAEEKTS